LRFEKATFHILGAGAAGRRTIEIPFNTWVEDFGFRMVAATTGDFKLHGIDFDVYVPDEERE